MTKCSLTKVLALAALLAAPAVAPALAQDATGGEGHTFTNPGPVMNGSERHSAVQYNDGTRWVESR
jgi:hypothetical protein